MRTSSLAGKRCPLKPASRGNLFFGAVFFEFRLGEQGGSFSETDFSGMAFKEAARKANPVILEPGPG